MGWLQQRVLGPVQMIPDTDWKPRFLWEDQNPGWEESKMESGPALGYYAQDLGILADVFQGSNSAAGVT